MWTNSLKDSKDSFNSVPDQPGYRKEAGDCWGYDIHAGIKKATLASCAGSCRASKLCLGFVFVDSADARKTCFPKKQMCTKLRKGKQGIYTYYKESGKKTELQYSMYVGVLISEIIIVLGIIWVKLITV